MEVIVPLKRRDQIVIHLFSHYRDLVQTSLNWYFFCLSVSEKSENIGDASSCWVHMWKKQTRLTRWTWDPFVFVQFPRNFGLFAKDSSAWGVLNYRNLERVIQVDFRSFMYTPSCCVPFEPTRLRNRYGQPEKQTISQTSTHYSANSKKRWPVVKACLIAGWLWFCFVFWHEWCGMLETPPSSHLNAIPWMWDRKW